MPEFKQDHAKTLFFTAKLLLYDSCMDFNPASCWRQTQWETPYYRLEHPLHNELPAEKAFRQLGFFPPDWGGKAGSI